MPDDTEPKPSSAAGFPDANRPAFQFPLPRSRMEFTGERFVSGIDGQIKHEHYHRYLFASRYCFEKDVLDIASGEGYGSSLLAQIARNVIGVDIDHPSINYANKTYLSKNLSFQQGNATDLPISEDSIDVVVSFETIEHFVEQTRFIQEVVRVLKKDGLLIISSPNKPVYDLQNTDSNPFHAQELDRDEFIALLQKHFPYVAIYAQRALHGSVILQADQIQHADLETFETEDGFLFAHEPGLSNPAYFVALASNLPIPIPPNSLLHNSAHVSGLHAALEQFSQSATAARAEVSATETKYGEQLAFALAKHEAEAAEQNTKLEVLSAQFSDAVAKYDVERTNLAQARLQLAALESTTARQAEQLLRESRKLRDAKLQLVQILTSRSWILSSPIRAVGALRQDPTGAVQGAAQILRWFATLKLRAKLREQRLVRLLNATGSFVPTYYLDQYRDVAASGIDPALHYLRFGAAEQRNPSSEFSTAMYRSRHPELSHDANPLIDAVLTGRLDDGRVSHPETSGQTASNPPHLSGISTVPAVQLQDFSTLSYHEHENPEITIILDARIWTEAVKQTLHAIATVENPPAGELFVLVTVGADFTFAGARRMIVEDLHGLSYLDTILAQSRAPVAIFIDGSTAIENELIGTGLAMFSEADNIAVVCALRREANGLIVDAGLRLDPEGAVHARGAALPVTHYGVASVADVDVFTPGLFMFKKTAWPVLGEHAAEFATPAYASAERSMRIRAAGMRIICQPFMRAEVLWTSPTSHTHPIEKIERVSQRWSSVIENAKRHPRPRILFVDAFTPTPDRDAGSSVLCWYMRIFQDLGYQVTFLPAITLVPTDGYTDELRRQGIECVSLPGAETAEQYLREHASAFHVVILYRAHTANAYIDLVRRYAPIAKIIFNTVDLHFLRIEREAKMLQSAEKITEARLVKEIELSVVYKADCTVILSQVEYNILDDLAPSVYKAFIPLTQPIPGCEAPFESRKNIVFVGGFAHSPNVDAVKYLIEQIWPLLRAALPDVKLLIVGSEVTEEIQSFANAATGIEIRGFVPDLRELFYACRLTVAPLRYGAGMKGKIVNSLAHGVPCVTTQIGVEGSGLVVGRDIMVSDDVLDYAQAVVTAYSDREVWERLSANGVAFAQENFSIGSVTTKIQNMIQTLGLPAFVATDCESKLV